MHNNWVTRRAMVGAWEATNASWNGFAHEQVIWLRAWARRTSRVRPTCRAPPTAEHCGQVRMRQRVSVSWKQRPKTSQWTVVDRKVPTSPLLCRHSQAASAAAAQMAGTAFLPLPCNFNWPDKPPTPAASNGNTWLGFASLVCVRHIHGHSAPPWHGGLPLPGSPWHFSSNLCIQEAPAYYIAAYRCGNSVRRSSQNPKAGGRATTFCTAGHRRPRVQSTQCSVSGPSHHRPCSAGNSVH